MIATTPNSVSRVTAAALVLILILSFGSVGRAEVLTPGVVYVSPKGDDQWSGESPSLKETKSGGPFATVERAVRALREWRKHFGSGGNCPATIYLASGYYWLTQPLTLTPEDSGLTLAALDKERPVLSGGRRITGWKQTQRGGKHLWAAVLPEVREGQWFFRELWVNGKPAVRARYPNHGYLKIANLVDARPDWMRGQTRFRCAPWDLVSWPTITEGEIVVMTRWADSRLPVFSVEEDQWVVNFTKRSVFALMEGDLYYLEGTFEALDQPGEWYLDRRAGTLFYWPRPGECLKNLSVVAPNLTQVVRLEGRPEQEQFVEKVLFRGLAFSHTEWCFPPNHKDGATRPAEPEVGGFGQSEVGVPGAVWGEGVRDSAFENCAFENLGNYGLELGRGCQSNRISYCEFSNLGSGGLKIGETAMRERKSEQARANEVSDCRIHDGGLMFHSAAGIWIGQSPDNRVLHNLIHDFYQIGISIGWSWGYGPAMASNNLVAFNHVHHIGVKSNGDGPILSDMGGIYTLGKQPGTRIENNLWHDIAGLRYGGWGIYLDEGSSGIVVTSNVVYRTTHGGFHQHYGETNSVWNNIFAFGRDQQLQRTRPEAHPSFSFQTNIVYFDNGAVLGGEWSQDAYLMDWNVYFDARVGPHPERMQFANASLEQWRKRGHDTHSIISDPLFIAPRKYDFRLCRQSPALTIGFKPIDLSQVGVRSK